MMLELPALILAIMVSIAVYLALKAVCMLSMRRSRSNFCLVKSVNLVLMSLLRVARRRPVEPT